MNNPFSSKIKVALANMELPPAVEMQPYKPPIYPKGHTGIPQLEVQPFNEKLAEDALNTAKVRLRQEANRLYELHVGCIHYAESCGDQGVKDKLNLVAARLIQAASILDSGISAVE